MNRLSRQLRPPLFAPLGWLAPGAPLRHTVMLDLVFKTGVLVDIQHWIAAEAIAHDRRLGRSPFHATLER